MPFAAGRLHPSPANGILKVPIHSMSSLVAHLPDIPSLLRLLGIFVVALLLNRLLGSLTRQIVKPAASQARGAQAREQQTRALADMLQSAVSKFIWVVALLTAAQEFGINVMPVVILGAVVCLALGLGAQNLVRDIIGGFSILLEDQYVVGESIQASGTIGRVEQLTLRRTVVRDSSGALVTFSNGDLRTVGNLSRDWSQTFVDVAVSPAVPQELVFQVLEAASNELRADSSWSQALVDGPRVLGLQACDSTAATLRLQVRTMPSRQDDVARELRRRIQLEFQRRGIPLSHVQRVELLNADSFQENRPPAAVT
jgi:small-conductance mechanosensitive channel